MSIPLVTQRLRIKGIAIWPLAAALSGLLPSPVLATDDPHAVHRQGKPSAPGYNALGFELPAPGSYVLPPLGQAANGKVLTRLGKRTTLHQLQQGKLSVLSFIYTSCPDVNACPLASFVLSQVQRQLTEHPILAERVRLITLSFDPVTDTPAVMAAYGARFDRRHLPEWAFVTTRNQSQLAPILEGYNQWVLREKDTDGNPTTAIAHLLRVYLVDEQGQIRNIYSSGFLHADLLMADLQTLALEHQE